MHDAYTPTFFTRHSRPLRGVMIDNQPWFSAYDFARLLGLHHPQALHRRLRPHETRCATICYANGNQETVHLINEAGLYKALIRFGHPECQQLDEWLTREVIPILRDQHAPDTWLPRRVMMSWQSRRLMLLEWQGELWMPWEDAPRYEAPCPARQFL
ncbi:Bro-N domain-containing protein [Pseudomonas sp. MOB-449]|nr:Bro-N domain-containing protein [Pseudomonas sp. MOB-449]